MPARRASWGRFGGGYLNPSRPAASQTIEHGESAGTCRSRYVHQLDGGAERAGARILIILTVGTKKENWPR
jgi:hypothetical protein